MEALQDRLRKVAAEFGVITTADGLPTAGTVAGVPSTLLVAHNLLTRRFGGAATNDERRQIIESANAAHLAAERDWHRSTEHTERDRLMFEVHSRAIRALIWLAAAKTSGFLEQTPLPELMRFHRTLIQIAQDLQVLEDPEHALALLSKAKEVHDVVTNNTRQIALIDAIHESKDQLTRRVRDLLRTAVGVEHIQYFDVAGKGLTGLFRKSVSLQAAPWPAFVTVDSSKHGGEKLIQRIFDECRQPGIYVIDLNYSSTTNKVVLHHEGHYFPYASSFDDKELTVVLRRPFEGIKIVAGDRRELPIVCSASG